MNAYRLCFHDISLMLSIGIHAFEREKPQRYLVSVDLLCAEGDQADAIGAVFDYDAVHALAHTLAGAGHYDLQETFCRKLADGLMAMGAFHAVVVSAGKPDVYPDVALVGCTMARGSPEALAQLQLLRGL